MGEVVRPPLDEWDSLERVVDSEGGFRSFIISSTNEAYRQPELLFLSRKIIYTFCNREIPSGDLGEIGEALVFASGFWSGRILKLRQLEATANVKIPPVAQIDASLKFESSLGQLNGGIYGSISPKEGLLELSDRAFGLGTNYNPALTDFVFRHAKETNNLWILDPRLADEEKISIDLTDKHRLRLLQGFKMGAAVTDLAKGLSGIGPQNSEIEKAYKTMVATGDEDFEKAVAKLLERKEDT